MSEREERRRAFKEARRRAEGPQGPVHQPSWKVEAGLATLLIAIAIFGNAVADWLF